MNNHKNARLTVHGRSLLVRRVVEDGLRPWLRFSMPIRLRNQSNCHEYALDGSRMEGMINSVLRFIDMESLQVMPMSEYNF